MRAAESGINRGRVSPTSETDCVKMTSKRCLFDPGNCCFGESFLADSQRLSPPAAARHSRAVKTVMGPPGDVGNSLVS
jgi:hypothetical protein